MLALIHAGRLPAQKFGRDFIINPKDLERVRVRKTGRPPSAKPVAKKPKGRARAVRSKDD